MANCGFITVTVTHTVICYIGNIIYIALKNKADIITFFTIAKKLKHGLTNVCFQFKERISNFLKQLLAALIFSKC